jgi:signal transduction histidine kinase
MYLSHSDKIARSPSCHRSRSTLSSLVSISSQEHFVTCQMTPVIVAMRHSYYAYFRPKITIIYSPQQGVNLSPCTLPNMWWSLFAFVFISFWLPGFQNQFDFESFAVITLFVIILWATLWMKESTLTILEISLWVHIILQSTRNIIRYTTVMISLDEIYCAFERLPTK